jgi:hypothetical protein
MVGFDLNIWPVIPAEGILTVFLTHPVCFQAITQKYWFGTEDAINVQLGLISPLSHAHEGEKLAAAALR